MYTLKKYSLIYRWILIIYTPNEMVVNAWFTLIFFFEVPKNEDQSILFPMKCQKNEDQSILSPVAEKKFRPQLSFHSLTSML
jgi:hypothetical protein